MRVPHATLFQKVVLLCLLAFALVSTNCIQKSNGASSKKKKGPLASVKGKAKKKAPRGRKRGALHIQSLKRSSRGILLRFFLRAPRSFEEILLARSTSPLSRASLDIRQYPITLIRLRGKTLKRLRDVVVGEGVRYHYRLYRVHRGNQKILQVSAQSSVQIPNRSIRGKRLQRPHIFINKFRYTLTLLDGRKVIKRYPVALGQNPLHRKTFFDNATTPEGHYKVSYRWPKSRYFKALGLSYPNTKDRRRYRKWQKRQRRLGRSAPAIGGAIQIHGQGIQHNWTFGCIAMRNADITELFSIRAVKKGIPVQVVGLGVANGRTRRFPMSSFLKKKLTELRGERP